MNGWVGGRGFTLIELMVTIVILAVLAAVAVTSYRRYQQNARTSEGINEINDIRMKQETFYNTYSRYEDTTGSANQDTFTGTMLGGAYTGYYHWTVTCPTAGNPWCNLGFRPGLQTVANKSNLSWFQYQSIGWAPGRTPPSFVQRTHERWLTVQARGIPESKAEQHCTLLRFTSDNRQIITLTQQPCQ